MLHFGPDSEPIQDEAILHLLCRDPNMNVERFVALDLAKIQPDGALRKSIPDASVIRHSGRELLLIGWLTGERNPNYYAPNEAIEFSETWNKYHEFQPHVWRVTRPEAPARLNVTDADLIDGLEAGIGDRSGSVWLFAPVSVLPQAQRLALGSNVIPWLDGQSLIIAGQTAPCARKMERTIFDPDEAMVKTRWFCERNTMGAHPVGNTTVFMWQTKRCRLDPDNTALHLEDIVAVRSRVPAWTPLGKMLSKLWWPAKSRGEPTGESLAVIGRADRRHETIKLFGAGEIRDCNAAWQQAMRGEAVPA